MSQGLFVALLAAGSARRFGGGKLDAALGGTPLGRHALDAALALDRADLVIVVGDPAPAFAAAAAASGEARLIVNRRAAEGLGGSVALAARAAADAGCARLLLLLADMPLVAPATLQRLADAAVPGRPAAVRHADGLPGIPACFPADFLQRLEKLEGERGAGPLLRQAAGTILIDTPAGELSDVDTPADLGRIETLLSARPTG